MIANNDNRYVKQAGPVRPALLPRWQRTAGPRPSKRLGLDQTVGPVRFRRAEAVCQSRASHSRFTNHRDATGPGHQCWTPAGNLTWADRFHGTDWMSADAEDEHDGVIHGEHVGLGESGAGRLAGVHGAGQVFTLSRGCR